MSHQALAMWDAPVQTPPSPTQQTLRHNNFSSWVYDFRQAAAHPTCAGLSISIFLPFKHMAKGQQGIMWIL